MPNLKKPEISPMRLGAVPYLNARPLYFYLKERPRLASPVDLVTLMKSGDLDLATAPITLLFENPHFKIIPGMAIGAKGPVASVKLFFKRINLTIQNITKIYLDYESSVSALLLKVLLQSCFHRNLSQLEFVTNPYEAEARLLIGDKALAERTTHSLDLAEAWTRWSGLPFVFATWITPKSSLPASLVQELKDCRDRSLANLEPLIDEERIFSPALLKTYFESNVSYELGPKEIEGMQRFYKYLVELKLVKPGWVPQFVNVEKDVEKVVA